MNEIFNELDSTLLVLTHLNETIKSRTNFCKRNVQFSYNECIRQKITEKIDLKIEISDSPSDPILAQIARECVDLKLIQHNYNRLNIIDMFSFNDEYCNFFSVEKFNDEITKKRIEKVKEINKTVRKKINWTQLQKFRNNILAHNLRDKKDNYKIALKTFSEIDIYLDKTSLAIEYSEVVLQIYQNIFQEFEVEIELAKENLKRYKIKKTNAQSSRRLRQ